MLWHFGHGLSDCTVTVLDLRQDFDEPRIRFIQGDLTSKVWFTHLVVPFRAHAQTASQPTLCMRQQKDVDAAVAGQDVVFHVAAAPAKSTDASLHQRINVCVDARVVAHASRVTHTLAVLCCIQVLATQHVIAACKASNVSALVATSSCSVIFEGRNQAAADETTPYPRQHWYQWCPTHAAAAAAYDAHCVTHCST